MLSLHITQLKFDVFLLLKYGKKIRNLVDHEFKEKILKVFHRQTKIISTSWTTFKLFCLCVFSLKTILENFNYKTKIIIKYLKFPFYIQNNFKVTNVNCIYTSSFFYSWPFDNSIFQQGKLLIEILAFFIENFGKPTRLWKFW